MVGRIIKGKNKMKTFKEFLKEEAFDPFDPVVKYDGKKFKDDGNIDWKNMIVKGKRSMTQSELNLRHKVIQGRKKWKEDLKKKLKGKLLNSEHLTNINPHLYGDAKNIKGDASGLIGFISPRLVGDVSNLRGDISETEGIIDPSLEGYVVGYDDITGEKGTLKRVDSQWEPW